MLFGCADKPIIRTVDQIVKVPVQVPCHVDKIEAPLWGVDKLTQEDDLFKQLQITLSELEQRRAYEVKLEAAIKTCNDN